MRNHYLRGSAYILMSFVSLWIASPAGYSQCVNSFPYFEDFESSDGGWTAGPINSGGIGASTWVWDIPMNPVIDTAFSGVSCWITRNDTNSFSLPPYVYAPNEFSAVESPCLDFSNIANPGIQMMIWYESEFNLDGTVFQGSTDGGNTWFTIGGYLDELNWYNDTAIIGNTNGGPGGGNLGWSGINANSTGTGGWIPAQHLLDGMGGQANCKIRFAFASNNNSDPASLFDGFAFDDILIADVPVLDIGNDTLICFAQALTLSACDPGGVSWQWNNNPVDTFCTKLAVSTSTFTVRMVDTLGFIVRDTFELRVSDTFVNLGSDVGLCPDDTLFLDAGNPWADHLWLPDSSTSQTIDIVDGGTYTVIVSDSLGCIEVDSIKVIRDVVPPTELGNDTTLCADQSIVLDASIGNPGTTYLWSPINATTQTVTISAPGTYSVLATSPFGCTIEDSITISVVPIPALDLGADTTVCFPFSLDVSNPNAVYLWSTGDTTPTLDINSGGIYSVIVANQFGCARTDTIEITEGILPVVNLGPDQVICGPDPLVLGPGGNGISYLWSTGESSQTIVANFPGQYTLTITSFSGCKVTDTIQVEESFLSVDLGPDVIVCDGDNVVLNGGSTATMYNWSTGETSQTISVTQAGTYTVTVMDDIGCVLSDTVVIDVQPNTPPTFTVSGDTVIFDTLTFAVDAGTTADSYLWEFGDGSTSTDPTTTHTYQSFGLFNVCLTTSLNGCESQTCTQIDVQLPSSLDLGLEGQVRLYPNPSSGVFQLDVRLDGLSQLEVAVWDLSGRTLWQQDMGQGIAWNQEMDLSYLTPGIYLLKIQTDQGTALRKLVKQ
ncbi:MAG: T9SS type A sorting domain-containing protein [Bacteroidota bacterium]